MYHQIYMLQIINH